MRMQVVLVLLAAFAVMLLFGALVQALIPIALPSVSVAFVDGGVFRTWAGFGLRETIYQAAILSVLLAYGHGMIRRIGGRATQHGQMLITAFFFGAAPTFLTVFLAIRIPAIVVLTWACQTLLQLATGSITIVSLSHAVPWGRRAALLIITSILLSAGVLAMGYYFPAPMPDESITVMSPNGKPVTIDCFLPDEGEKHSAVVVLHGVEGATLLSRRVHYLNARAIRDKGYATFFVRYFDASPYEDLMIRKNGHLDVAAIEEIRRRDYENWVDVACAAIRKVDSREDVGELVVIGYSLGTYVGTAASSRLSKDGIPKAMVGNFGSVWPEVETDASFPPIRFYHGAQDSVVPLAAIEEAVSRLRESGAPSVELMVYPDQGHVPEGPASLEIRTSTEQFLRSQLSLTGP